jgi:hypothetical protein
MKRNLAFLFAVPLFRLLAINLAIGVAAALLMTGGLLALNPHDLRGLLLSDPSGATVFVLLLFGFVVTFGSTAMGTAIMALGRDTSPRGGKGANKGASLGASEPVAEPVPVKLSVR